MIPHFKICLDVILDRADMDDDFGEIMEKQARDLYGLIHTRFILTKKGQERMYRKFKNAEFGICPMLACEGFPVLPVGLDDAFNVEDEDPLPVHVFCPRCRQVMLPARNCIDINSRNALNGAYFGTTFPHLFLMQFPTLIPRPPLKMDQYVPKVFGFKVRTSKLLHSQMDQSSGNEKDNEFQQEIEKEVSIGAINENISAQTQSTTESIAPPSQTSPLSALVESVKEKTNNDTMSN